jgi:hypothetical protein
MMTVFFLFLSVFSFHSSWAGVFPRTYNASKSLFNRAKDSGSSFVSIADSWTCSSSTDEDPNPLAVEYGHLSASQAAGTFALITNEDSVWGSASGSIYSLSFSSNPTCYANVSVTGNYLCSRMTSDGMLVFEMVSPTDETGGYVVCEKDPKDPAQTDSYASLRSSYGSLPILELSQAQPRKTWGCFIYGASNSPSPIPIGSSYLMEFEILNGVIYFEGNSIGLDTQNQLISHSGGTLGWLGFRFDAVTSSIVLEAFSDTTSPLDPAITDPSRDAYDYLRCF